MRFVLVLVLLALTGCELVSPGSQPTVAPTPADSGHEQPVPTAPADAPPVTPAPGAVEPAPTAPPPLATEPPRPAARAEIEGRLLYVRQGNLYRLSGGVNTQLTTTGDLAWPRWAPDGQRIAVARRGDSFSEVHVLDAEGQNPSQLTRYQSKLPLGSKEYVMASVWAITPNWEPSGSRLIYAADVTADNMALWQVDAKGGTPRPLAATADLGANIESPVYAPDGKSLIFCLARDTPTQLWLLNLTTGGKTQITDGKQTTYDPAWAPDGNLLAVAVQDGPSSGIALLTPDGARRTPLIRRPAARAPTWSPDGRHLAFIGEEGGKFNLFVVDLTGDGAGGFTASEPRRLTNDGDIDAPSGLSWAP